MKNILLAIFLIVFSVSPLFAQNDYNSMYRSIIIKINPPLIAAGIIGDGEFGATFQFPVLRGTVMGSSVDAFIGGGYNRNIDEYTSTANPNGTGYTIRAGLYSYIIEESYLSLQFFYRRWNIKGIYDVDGDPQDNIISPSTLLSPDQNDPVLYLENAKVNVYSFDIVYGNQYPHFHEQGQVFFEWYIGAGIRYKVIDLEELGSYNSYLTLPINGAPPGAYNSFSIPKYSSETSIYPDIKLGIMIGFVL